MKRKKVLLIIRDGWGHRKSHRLNAIYSAKIPYTNYLMKKYPNCLIHASGIHVGLPKNYQGNSEVGHMTIGSGRIMDQSLSRINRSIKNKSFFSNKAMLKAINNCKKHNSTLHIVGLLQVEGVHSHINHLFAILKLCKKEKFYNVKIHALTDGRDAPNGDGIKHLRELKRKLTFGEIVSITGRYYALDRDERWSRTRLAYHAIIEGKAKENFDNPIDCIKNAYKNKEGDEFLLPKVKSDYKGVKDKDSIIFFNFRTDRPRQFTKAVIENNFKGFPRKKKNIIYVAMTDYYKPIKAEIAFPEPIIKNNLGNVISKNGLKQFRISETEKYAHVTFFFNSQVEKANIGEDRLLIHSPSVSTYDLKPEMSVHKIQKGLIKALEKNKYDLIVTNLVNGDMVGHTGKIPAIKKAVKSVDLALKKIVEKALECDYECLIFADHGNAEDQRKQWLTSHTINKVPFIYVSNQRYKGKLKKGSSLQDIAPTALKLLGIKKPKEMSGKSIL